MEKGVKKTEKRIANVAKKVQNTKVDEKGRKMRKMIDEKVSNFFKKGKNKMKETLIRKKNKV